MIDWTMIDWYDLEIFWGVSVVTFSLNSLLQCLLQFSLPSRCQWSCISGSKSHKSFVHSWHWSQPLFQQWRGKGPGYVCGAATLLLQGILFMFARCKVVGWSTAVQMGCCQTLQTWILNWINSQRQSLLRLPSSPSSDLHFPPSVLGLMSCITREFNLCPS